MNRNALYSNLQSCCRIQREEILGKYEKVKEKNITSLSSYFYLPSLYLVSPDYHFLDTDLMFYSGIAMLLVFLISLQVTSLICRCWLRTSIPVKIYNSTLRGNISSS